MIMHRNAFAVGVVLALVAPSLLAGVQAATPEDYVPFTSGDLDVEWQPVSGVTTRLFFTSDSNLNDQGQTAVSHAGGFTTLPPERTDSGTEPDRENVQYDSVTTNGATFVMPVLHDFNVTGNHSVRVQWWGHWNPGTSFSVTLSSSTDGRFGRATAETQSAGESFLGGDAGSAFDDPIGVATVNIRPDQDHEGRFQFKQGSNLILRIQSEEAGAQGWTMIQQSPSRPSYLELLSHDAVKTAAWTEDNRGDVKDFFRPIRNPSTAQEHERNQVDVWFAVRSAFGGEDLVGNRDKTRLFDPSLYLFRNDAEWGIGTDNLTEFPLIRSDRADPASDGIVAYQLNPAADLWDIRKEPSGEFMLRGQVDLRPESLAPGKTVTAEWPFVISTQNLDLRLYDDDDPLTDPSPLDSTSHEVAIGGSTAWALLVENRGDVNDTLVVDAEVVTATAGENWNTRILGDHVIGGNRIQLEPGEQKVFMVRLEAPGNADLGSQAIVEVTATSGVDKSVTTDALSLIATVSDRVRQEAGVIVPGERVDISPRETNEVTVYAWNRGTRTANVTLQLREEANSLWNTYFRNRGGGQVDTVTIDGLGAGEITPVTLYVYTTAESGGTRAYNATVAPLLRDARNTEVEETFKRDVDLFAQPRGGFKVDVLPGVGGDRLIEMDYSSGISDAPDGQWFRTWITNTGDFNDTYRLQLVTDGGSFGQTISGDGFLQPSQTNPGNCGSFQPGPADDRPGCSEDSLSYGEDTWHPHNIFTRNRDGTFQTTNNVQVPPGRTAEVYVWISHNGDLSETFLNFGLRVESERSGTVKTISENLQIRSQENGGSRHADVLLEPVQRDPNYETNRLVDLRYKDHEGVIEDSIALGGEWKFRVRVTHAFAWRDAEFPLTFGSVDDEIGWNVSMRRVDGQRVSADEDPWSRTLTVTNDQGTGVRQFQSYYDEEIEIRVQPPAENSTRPPSANDFTEFKLYAGTSNSNFDELEFRIYVRPEPNVTLNAVHDVEFVHPGDETAFAVQVFNNGSVASHATLIPTIREESNNADGWSIVAGTQSLTLDPHTNQSAPIRVVAPPNAVSGDRGLINVTLEYVDVNGGETKRDYMELTAIVRDRGSLRIETDRPTVNIEPGGRASFIFSVTNTGQTDGLRFRAEASPLVNWTQQLSPTTSAPLDSGESTTLALVLTAPSDLIRGSSYTSVVRVFAVDEAGEDRENFDLIPVTVNVVEGRPVPQVVMDTTEGIVDRAGVASFIVGIRNVGNANGTFPLETRIPDAYRQDGWRAWVEDASGANITEVTLRPRERVNVNLTVFAPMDVDTGTVVPVSLGAFEDDRLTRKSEGIARVAIHDYGLSVQLEPTRQNIIPGGGAEFRLRLTNLGNGPDTIRLSADQEGLSTWDTQFSRDSLRLRPGETGDLSLIVRTPTDPLPPPREYTMRVIGSSEGGASVNVFRNDSAPFVVNVLDYRQYDVDGDDVLEIAIDRNRRASDGYEEFREVSVTEGVTTELFETVDKPDGKIGFLLDTPEDGIYDGVADVYFDPDLLFHDNIEHTPDVNGDASPDYLLDTDGDGTIDSLWDPAARSMSRVTVISAFGGDAEQYLIDTDGDGTPDWYFDPDEDLVTRTTQNDDGTIGIDTDDDGRPNKFYDTESGTVTSATVSNFTDFARQYWPFFAMFVLVILVFAGVLVRRHRN